ISRDIQEVALLPPDNVVLKLVDELVRRLELARPWHVRVNDDPSETFRGYFTGIAGDGNITKTLKREVRFVSFKPATFKRVLHRLLRSAQVRRVEVAGFVQHFGVSQ